MIYIEFLYPFAEFINLRADSEVSSRVNAVVSYYKHHCGSATRLTDANIIVAKQNTILNQDQNKTISDKTIKMMTATELKHIFCLPYF